MVDDLRAGKDVRPSRGPNKVCTFKQVSRTLAGFSDGLADEGVGAGPASLEGLKVAKQHNWTAPGSAQDVDSDDQATAEAGGHQPQPGEAHSGAEGHGTAESAKGDN
jgi:NADH-quinone oxidoreductase subunit E